MKCEGCGQEREEGGLVGGTFGKALVRCFVCIQKAVDESAKRGCGYVIFK